MTKDRFLKGLKRELHGIRKQERQQYIRDYEELIADMTENGMSEEEAVAKQGDYKAIAAEIVSSVGEDRRMKRDVPGLLLHIITVLLIVLSLVCVVLFPGIATIGIVDGDGASAVFFAGKMTEPVVLYIMTCVVVVADCVYAGIRKKKGYVITAVILLCVFAIAFAVRKPVREAVFGATTEEVQEEPESSIEEKTGKILDLLFAGDYTVLREEYTADVMLPYMTAEDMEEAKRTICEDWGDGCTYGKMYVETVTQNGVEYTIVQVSASYENTSVFYTITYDADGKIAGLYMK